VDYSYGEASSHAPPAAGDYANDETILLEAPGKPSPSPRGGAGLPYQPPHYRDPSPPSPRQQQHLGAAARGGGQPGGDGGFGSADADRHHGKESATEIDERIRREKRELQRMKAENAFRDEKRVEEWKREVDEKEAKQRMDKASVIRKRKESLESKRLDRLEKASQRKKLLTDLRHDDTAARYGEEQRRREQRREADYLHRVKLPEVESISL